MAEQTRAPPNHHRDRAPPPPSSTSSSSSSSSSSSVSSSHYTCNVATATMAITQTTTLLSDATTTTTSSSNSPTAPPRPHSNRYYFSRRVSSFKAIPQMPTADDFVGIYSPWAVLWGLLFLTVPLSYFYIGLVLLREICRNFPALLDYLPTLMNKVVHYMQYKSWRIVEYWCWLEGVFYILMKLKIYWLQRMDPLEASLSAAPLLKLDERAVLWRRMMESEVEDPVGFITGWFFDCNLESITRYDVCDFCAWSMFEGRHQEHLTNEELRQLEDFVEEAEYRISLQLYGEAEEAKQHQQQEEDNNLDHKEQEDVVHPQEQKGIKQQPKEEVEVVGNENLCGNGHSAQSTTMITAPKVVVLAEKSTTNCGGGESENGADGDLKLSSSPSYSPSSTSRRQKSRRLRQDYDDNKNTNRNNVVQRDWKSQLPKPKKMFHFAEESHQSENSFFFNLYESYRKHYETMNIRDKLGATNFHPMERARNLFQETANQLSQAEETAMATASQMYEHLVPTVMDKHLTAMSQATYAQLTEAWNSVKNMKERLETARFLTQQRTRIRQQLKGYRVMLNRMREMSSVCDAVPSAQMAAMMRRITECNLALQSLEGRAQVAFVNATGFARKNLPSFVTQEEESRTEPRHYARYSSDPLLGIATYPLGFHLLVLGGTEIPLRIMMKQRGFERRTIGPVSYYFHPGRDVTEYYDLDSLDRADHGIDDLDDDEADFDWKTPIIFVHGIGIGLIVYIPLIDKLLETGRPILLPEIPYVSGFRPWQSPLAVLSPGSVVSTMTAMLASHGFMRGTWVGHSYGTSWLSYMVKFARHAVASVVFLDPICFSLHVPRLTKSFVYSKPDPGTISYIVRTDIIVNWTIQRSFPWAWIVLFLEQIGDVPCAIFLSDKDGLVPADKVEAYLRKRQVPICDFDGVKHAHFDQPRCCTVFRGDGHGDWTDRPSATSPTIALAVEALCRQAENQNSTTTTSPLR